ncbi:MAG: cytochrome c biogenesis protein CcsA [Candidatus Hydrogenedentes bacterium]|nr:cytochrome c biogenesis protein CcsA [Candidatus Hydrogenedentota bacterium]
MDMFVVGTRFPQPRQERLELLASLEQLWGFRNDPIAFNLKLRELNVGITAAAKERGEYKKLPLEVHFYKYKYLTYSQWLYALSFLLVAILWLRPENKLLHGMTIALFSVPTALLIIGMVLRCIVRGRPPVSTLYETILFITAIVALCALFMEIVNRRRIALSAGAFLGVAGMFLAFRYEAKEGVDTMPALIAVLDTNFWLATHVTTVVAGYAAGLFAAAISHVYIFGKLFRLKEDDADFYESMTRMSYGIICFGLLFATVGTILGGVWANDSWGRFWGWDPKENGALMIVLWMLIVLHARLAEYIRDLGLHVMAVTLGMVVAFSWWGVNNLGVGLHSYGFIEGVWRNLTLFWLFESFVVLLALVLWYQNRQKSPDIAACDKKS